MLGPLAGPYFILCHTMLIAQSNHENISELVFSWVRITCFPYQLPKKLAQSYGVRIACPVKAYATAK
jgi:hypothetical protein